jgi:diguanylate cyclase (GGDEF)-like protein
MGWPRTTAPAWPVYAGLAGVSVAAALAYVVADPQVRPVIYSLATAVPVSAFLAALVARHLTDRVPWATATVGLVLLAGAMVVWPDWITGHSFGRAEVPPATLVIATAHLMFFLGAGGALRRHARSDPGGIVDAALFGICSAGPIWAWGIAPNLAEGSTPLGQMLVLCDIMVMAGVLGCLVRIGLTARKASAPIGLFVLTCLLTLAADVVAVLTVHGSAIWTVELMMPAYLCMAAAAVHPAAPFITIPVSLGKEGTGEPPLLWTGAALCANPLIASVQALRGEMSAAGLLLPIGSLLVVPLVMLRLRQLSAQRARAERTLAHHAHHDELTGLHNRRHITAEIDQALAALRDGTLDEITVLLCDLDGFKPINDRFGHQAGDAVLKTVAARLTAGAGPADTVGRIGGDEFLILRRGTCADGFAGQVAKLLRQPIQLGGTTVEVGVSIGAAQARRGADIDRDTLIGLADTEMYAVKADHRRDAEPALR